MVLRPACFATGPVRSALVSALAGLVLGSATGCRSTDVHESMLEPASHLDLRLKPCPQSPNCVSSQKWNAGGRVAPIPIEGGPEETLDRFAALIEADPRAEVVERQRIYLRAEYRSALLRFIDDLELLVDEEGGVVHVRSASRLGWSDGGVNRRRVEALRQAFAQELVPLR